MLFDHSKTGRLRGAFRNQLTRGRRKSRNPGVGFELLEARLLLSGTPAASNFSTESASADFDGDGRDDPAYLDLTKNLVTVRISVGDGTFRAPVSYPLKAMPQRVVVGDFNGDGRPDLAVSTVADVEVLLNRGDGTFSAPVVLTPGKDFGPIVIGGVYYTTIQDDDFGPIVVGDFNGDGHLDLAMEGSAFTSGSISEQKEVLLYVGFGNGDGTFRAPVSLPIHQDLGYYPAGPNGEGFLVAGDFAGDGKSELAAAAQVGPYDEYRDVVVLKSEGSGPFQIDGKVHSAHDINGFSAGDLNGDGRADLVLGEGSWGTEVFLGSEVGTFDSGASLDMGTGIYRTYGLDDIALGDFNADGKLDILEYAKQAIEIALNRGDGTFGATLHYLTDDQLASREVPTDFGTLNTIGVVGDFDGNGAPDFAYVSAAGDPSVNLNEGDGSFPLPRDQPIDLPTPSGDTLNGQYIRATIGGDFLGHGQTDVALVHGGNVEVVEKRDDGTFEPPISTTTPSYFLENYFLGVSAADVNGDGKVDLVEVGSVSDGEPMYPSYAEVLLNRGDGTFAVGQRLRVADEGEVLHVDLADLNGDGKPDLVMTNLDSGTVIVTLGNGDGTFKSPTTYGLGETRAIDRPAPAVVVVADVNGDGKPDLVIGGESRNYDVQNDDPDSSRVYDSPTGVSVLLGKGDGTFRPATFFEAPHGLANFVIADFNGDGKADIAFNHGPIGEVPGGFGGEDPGPPPPGTFSSLPETPRELPTLATILLGQSDGSFQVPDGSSNLGNYYLEGAADLNGDGLPDLIVERTHGATLKLINLGHGTFAPPVLLTPSDARQGLPDLASYFEGDGRLELGLKTDEGFVLLPITPVASIQTRNARITATATVPVSGLDVAGLTITGPDASITLTASIDWGDGTTSTGRVIRQSFVHGSGDAPDVATLAVIADHTFARSGSLDVRVTLTRPDGTRIYILSPAQVAVSLSATASGPLEATEEVLLNSSVEFTSTDESAEVGDFRATIDWGDGSSADSATIFSIPAGPSFGAVGSHVYAHSGTYSIRTTIMDRAGNSTSTQGQVVVAPLALDPSGANNSLIRGYSLVGVDVASFNGPQGGLLNLGLLSASIDWGDGVISAGSPTRFSGSRVANSIDVRGSHTYQGVGTFAVVVTLKVANGRTFVARGSTTVESPHFQEVLTVGDSTERQSLPSFSAVFSTDDPASLLSHPSAMIDWGDGTTSAGSVVVSRGPVTEILTVGGGHTYEESGVYEVRVQVADDLGQTDQVEGRAVVADLPIALTGRLDPGSDGGPSSSDGITNDPRPVFEGTSEPNSVVQVIVLRSGDLAPMIVGRSTADASGRWSVTSSVLADGIYTVAVEALDAAGLIRGGATLSATAWGDTLVVDTAGPKLVSVSVDASAGRFALTFEDAFGIDAASLVDASRFLVVGPPESGSLSRRISGVWESGPASSPTLYLSVPGVLVPGLYAVGVTSSGVGDSAGNAISGLLTLEDVGSASTGVSSSVAPRAIAGTGRSAVSPSLLVVDVVPSQQIPKFLPLNRGTIEARELSVSSHRARVRTFSNRLLRPVPMMGSRGDS